MGIFNKLGRKIEEFKQEAKEAADETADYQCQACNVRLQTEYDECPDCGAQEVKLLTDGE